MKIKNVVYNETRPGHKRFYDDLVELMMMHFDELRFDQDRIKIINHPQSDAFWVHYVVTLDEFVIITHCEPGRKTKTSKYIIIDWQDLYKNKQIKG